MSNPVLGHYHFLPWIRQGLARAVQTVDDPANPADVAPRLDAKLTVVALKDGTVTLTKIAGVTVNIYSHGHIVGFDRAQVTKTEPKHGTPSFEPNFFAGIEFDHPGFPWAFTPAAPSGEKLRPWLSLIVLPLPHFLAPTDTPPPPPPT